jgi:TFIIF-interacting CTD phosphatase-like protein
MAKLNFILDLDQTIISAYKIDKEGKNLIDDSNENKLEPIEKFTKSDNSDHLILGDNSYFVKARPGLQNFLNFLFKNFEVSVWTAASKEYAKEIIKHFILKPNKHRKIKCILWLEHCRLSAPKQKNYVIKNLQFLNSLNSLNDKKNIFTPENTILLDDGEHHCNYNDDNYNKNHIILAEPFFFIQNGTLNQEDHFLNDLEINLKNILKNKKNAETIVKELKKIKITRQ